MQEDSRPSRRRTSATRTATVICAFGTFCMNSSSSFALSIVRCCVLVSRCLTSWQQPTPASDRNSLTSLYLGENASASSVVHCATVWPSAATLWARSRRSWGEFSKSGGSTGSTLGCREGRCQTSDSSPCPCSRFGSAGQGDEPEVRPCHSRQHGGMIDVCVRRSPFLKSPCPAAQ